MKYRFKQSYGGILAGATITDKDFTNDAVPMYRWLDASTGAFIEITADSPLLEVVKEPIYPTDEPLVYYKSESVGIFTRIEYYFIDRDNCIQKNSTYSKTFKEFASTVVDGSKTKARFATEKAAKDYLALQKAIEESGYSVGDKLPFGANYYILTPSLDSTGLFTLAYHGGIGTAEITGFTIYGNTPAFIIKGSAGYDILVRMAGVPAKITSKRIVVSCDRIVDDFYVEVGKGYIKALNVGTHGENLNINVTALSQLIKTMEQYGVFYDYKISFPTVQIGCKKGIRIDQLKAVLNTYREFNK